jgi:hypothetical protein
MIGLLEIANKASNGPKMDEKEWNISLFKEMQQLKKRHGLEIPEPEHFYDVDNAYADSVYEASVDFLSEMGVYCVTKGRVLKFTEEEVREAIREAPGEVHVGKNRDRRILRCRRVDDASLPNVVIGGHCPWSEDLISLSTLVQEMVRIQRVDALEGFNFVKIDGRTVDNVALATYAARRAVALIREGLRKAGRPGLAVLYYPVLTDTATLIAPISEESGIRGTDGVLLSVLPDLKVELNMIAASLAYDEIGAYRHNGDTFGWAKGFCGGWEGAMIESACKVIAGWMIYRDVTAYTPDIAMGMETHTIEGVEVKSMPPPYSWRNFAVSKALLRHGDFVFLGGGTPQLLPRDKVEEEFLLSTALSSISRTVLGDNLLYIATPPPSIISWGIESSNAAIKSHLKLPDLEEISQRILKEKLNGKSTIFGDPRQLLYYDPQKFWKGLSQHYDFLAQKPTEEFSKVKNAVRKYLESFGLEFAS